MATGKTATARLAMPAYPHAAQFVEQTRRALQSACGDSHPCTIWWQAPNQLWLKLQIGAQEYWLPIDASGLHTNLSSIGLGLMLAAGLLALLGAALIQRRLNRPLQQLAASVAAIGQDQGQDQTRQQRITDLPEQLQHGLLPMPQEIAAVAQALAHMAQDLQDAERERALMLAGVSHDLRTPLTKLRLAIEILMQSPLAASELDLLQGMSRQIKGADAVIAQFVAFARSGSDEALQCIDVCQLLQELAAESPYVDLQLPATSMALVCRPIALHRALGNLLENALRYAKPQESGPIAISVQQTAGQITISIADHGPGIPSAQRQHMRQPFTRLDAARSANEPNTGGRLGAGLGNCRAHRPPASWAIAVIGSRRWRLTGMHGAAPPNQQSRD